LAVLAPATAVLAGLAFRKQSQEVALLLQENQHQTAERRRTQAARVFTGIPRDPVRMVAPYAHNASDFPIFDAQLWYRAMSGLLDPEDLGTIMPGDRASSGRARSAGGGRPRSILTFRDAEGIAGYGCPTGPSKSKPTTRRATASSRPSA
jgi:hypothetical protein